jgi:anaerobic ribonucleoside-triphosphate reductase
MQNIKHLKKEKQIDLLKKQRGNVKGSLCEVYSRVVGYLRPVRGWNVGKKEEWKIRKNYKIGVINDRK